MLRKFVYLDQTTLAEYTATLEGGLIAETRTRSLKKGSKGARLGFKGVAEANVDGASERENVRTINDKPEAQFERLLEAANNDPDAIGWIDVMEPSSDFANAHVGEFISWDCQAHIPDLLRSIAVGGQGLTQLAFAQQFLQLLAQAPSDIGLRLGEVDFDQLTASDRAQADGLGGVVAAMTNFIKLADAKLAVVGEDDDVEWKVFGELSEEHLRVNNIDDERLVIVGKVRRVLQPGKWRRLAQPINFDVPNRAERRRLESEPPPAGTEDHYVPGPALELDILAIYR